MIVQKMKNIKYFAIYFESRFEEENSSEREARMSTEQQNVELRTQIARLTARLSMLYITS